MDIGMIRGLKDFSLCHMREEDAGEAQPITREEPMAVIPRFRIGLLCL